MYAKFAKCVTAFFLAIFPFTVFAAAEQIVSVGFVEKVYEIEEKVVIALLQKELFFDYQKEHPEQKLWQLLDYKNQRVGFFVIEEQEISPNGKLRLQGKIKQHVAPVYAGLQISVSLQPPPEPDLPDSFQSQTFLKSNIINAIDQSPMVLIPAGPFLYGSQHLNTLHYTSPIRPPQDTANRFFQPTRYQETTAFYMDRYEITNVRFAKFLQSTATTAPPAFDFQSSPNLPVTNVSYNQAESYCRWANKRLPSELEWEKAARGGVQKFLNINEQAEFLPADRIYPNGSTFDARVCNTRESGYGSVLDVNTLQDESPYRVVGMCGNAAEWTSSWLLPYRGNQMQSPLFGRKYKVIRGGSFNDEKTWARTYERRAGGIPSLPQDFRAGFRCVKSVN